MSNIDSLMTQQQNDLMEKRMSQKSFHEKLEVECQKFRTVLDNQVNDSLKTKLPNVPKLGHRIIIHYFNCNFHIIYYTYCTYRKSYDIIHSSSSVQKMLSLSVIPQMKDFITATISSMKIWTKVANDGQSNSTLRTVICIALILSHS